MKVCEIVRERVDFVILNACESAQFSPSSNTNLAQIFIKNGVQSVLAMAFSISASAVTQFLQAFYAHFASCPEDLLGASYVARRKLQDHAERDARFAIRASLQDFFVPVTYMSNTNVDLIRPSHQDETATGSGRLMSQDGFIGRDFDLLQFERHVLARGRAILTGPMGIGKTTLIRQMMHSWKLTNFVKICTYLNASLLKSCTIDDLFEHIMNSTAAEEVVSAVTEEAPCSKS